MGIISSVEPQKNNNMRVNIFVDGDFSCAMFLDFSIKYHLKAGMEISTENLQKIVKESDGVTAQNKALQYISKTPKTIHQVRTYLKGKGFDDEIIKNVIEKLKEYQYLSDEAYVQSYIESTKRKYGKKMMQLKLTQKGISKKLIEEAFATFECEDETIFGLAQKFLNHKEATYENLARVSRKLLGRGFSYDEVHEAISKLKNGE